MTEFKMRLVAHDPKTHERLGVLPDPLSADVGLPRLDVATATVSYPLAGARSDLIDRPITTGLCVNFQVSRQTKYGAGQWVDLPGGYMALHERSTDPAKRHGDGGQVMDCQLMSYAAYHLSGATLTRTNRAKYDSEGKRQFLSVSAGAIMRTYVDELQAAGYLAGVKTDFTATHDSAGRRWQRVVTLAIDEGEVDALTMLRSLADQGACDWEMVGRTLRLFNMDGACRDLSVGKGGRDAVRLVIGTDVADAPQSESVENLTQSIIVVGEEGKRLTLTDNTVPAPYGRRRATVTQGGVSDEGTMRALGEAQLRKLAQVESELTRELLLHDPRQLPVLDYRPGDWITGPGPDGKPARLRVAQVTLSLDKEGGVASGHVILGTRKLDLLLRMTRRMVGIVGGSKNDGGGGTRPAPGGPDKRVPATPAKPSLSSEAYTDHTGQIRSTVTAEWGEVTTDKDGVSMQVGGYRARWRLVDASNPKESGWRSFYDGQDTEWTRDRFAPKTRVAVQVQAQGPVRSSAWSPEAIITTADDDVPPPIPSKPIVSANLGVITVQWDGRAYDGAGMPADFRHVEVSVMDASSVDPAAPQPQVAHIWDRLDRPSTTQVTGRKNVQTFIRLRAVDTTGNKSAWSEEAVITAKNLVDVDEIIGVITDPDMLGPDVIHEKHIVASESLWAKLGKFVQIDAGMLRANEIWADDAWLGYARAQVLAVGAADPRKIGWGADDLAPNPVWADPELRGKFPAAEGWQYRGASDVPAWVVRKAQTHILTAFGSVLSGTTRRTLISGETPVAPGDKIGLEMDAGASEVSLSWTVGLQIVCVWPDGSTTTPATMRLESDPSRPTNNPTTYSGTFTVPDGVRGIRLAVQNQGPSTGGAWYVARVSARKGMTSGGAGGEGMEIVPRGIRAWDDKGEDILRLGVSQNALVVADTFRTGTSSTGPQVMLSNTVSGTGLPGVWLSRSGKFGFDEAGVYLHMNRAGQNTLRLRGPRQADGSRPPVYCEGGLDVDTGDLRVGYDGNSPVFAVNINSGNITMPRPAGGNIYAQTKVALHAGGGGPAMANGLTVESPSGGEAARVVMGTTPANWTTGNTSNMHITSTGNVFMCTSRRAAKTDIRPARLGGDVLDIEPVTFRDRGEVERRTEWENGGRKGEEPPKPRAYLGAVAEQVEDLGLDHLVMRDEGGAVQGLAYDRIAIALIPEVRALRDRLDTLTARLDALEAR